MKKIVLLAALVFFLAGSNAVSAQVRLNVNLNIGLQPDWGPVGYDYVEYYYLPDIEVYYYVPTHQFVYLSGRNWVFSYSLPPRCRNYDLYSGYKVVINQPRAYRYFPTHRARYMPYRGNHSQVIIRNNNDPRYYSVKGHPKFKENPGRGHGKGRH